MSCPKCLLSLIENFKALPGIGEKTAERLAFAMIDFSEEKLDDFSKSVVDIKKKIRKCSLCGHITESELCDICRDKKRKRGVICVVEDSKSVILFEKNDVFDGKYHVLEGLISPYDGINPEDINIEKLLERIKTENIQEIIIALKPTLEGETTTLYILEFLKETNISVSKMAQGIPIGADIDYLDALTLEAAFVERKKIS